jgi:hypothetical protein
MCTFSVSAILLRSFTMAYSDSYIPCKCHGPCTGALNVCKLACDVRLSLLLAGTEAHLCRPQRVLHSVLCSRVLLLILRRRKIGSVEVQRSSMSESEATGMIFSSVVDDTTMGSIGVDTVSSSSRRVYAYPMSPGADDEEGRSRFNWL